MAESIPITDFKKLQSLRTNLFQDRRNACSDLRPVYALDSETDKNGDVMLIADSEGNFLDKITPESCLKFLFSKRYQGSWNFFYNIIFDAEVILKLLGDTLYSYKRSRKLSFKFDDYFIEYFPSKKLAIRKEHHSAVFFDIAQYYHDSLVNAYQNNIGKLDPKYLEIKQKRDSFSKWFFRDNKKLVIDYCIKDCKLTKELAEHWIKLFNLAFGFYPQRWISSGYLAEKVLINQNIPIPKFNEIPYEIQDFAWNCYYGGRFEILKRGFIGTAYLYDINSAYPFVFSNIPDFTKGKWRKSKTLDQNALLGFYKIECDIPDCKYVPPFPFKSNGKLIFPSGKFQTFCTLNELKACEKKYYSILDSWQYFDENPFYPYKEFVESIYNKRLQLKNQNNPMQLP
ncbi:MAG: DNA polymerase, partial [Thaumarchaeota archaeon]|nr:DNA polymerase [Nitrososphaerota archaeon]